MADNYDKRPLLINPALYALLVCAVLSQASSDIIGPKGSNLYFVCELKQMIYLSLMISLD